MKNGYETTHGTAQHGSVEIAYEVTQPLGAHAEIPGLVFIGGWGEPGRTWGQQVASLAPRFPTLTYDRRGLGKSSRPQGRHAYTVEQELADLETVLAHTGFGAYPLCVAGHSFGCHLLLAWLTQGHERRRARVRQAILLAPTSRALRDEDTPFGALGEQDLRVMYTGLLQEDFTFLQQFAHQAIPEGGQATEPLRQAIAQLVPHVMSSWIALWTFDLYVWQDLRPTLSQIELPTLVVSGALDPEMPPAAGADVTQRLQRATQQIIPQAGHHFHMTSALLVNRLIEAFLDERI
jgi:pimeloyl-ACP methyl ester carboxylesterase